MGHYFISYSTRDGEDQATRLYIALQAGPPPLTAWLDRPNIQIGDWSRQIDQAIKDCAALLLVVTTDSVNSPEVGNEWSRALRYKKPILPLRFDPDVDPPLRLEGHQEVDFISDFEQAMAKLRKLLLWLDTSDARIAALEQRRHSAERDLLRQEPSQRKRAELEISDLDAELRSLRGGTQPELTLPMDEPPPPERRDVLTINRAPSPPLRSFQDRVRETERIGEFLDDPAQRILTVVGRAGVGKTAMVCRALHSLARGEIVSGVHPRTSFEGIVYLGAGPARDISFANFYEDLGRLLPDAARSTAEDIWNQSPPTDVRVNALATLLANRPVVVLLDNFEDLLDATSGKIIDREFAEVLRLLLVAPEHGIKVIITTREAPRDLALLQPVRQDYIELDTGLTTPHAQNLLRSMDRDGRVGLRDAPEEVLDAVRERTLGFPRALEAFFAVLRADRFTSVDELLRGADVPENVVEALVAEAFSRLDQHARAVVQALAVFNRPVLAEAIEFLLPAGSSTGSAEAVLRRLATMYLVRHDQGKYYLHPADRAYALSQLEPGAPGDWTERREGEPQTLATLRYLGAEYFRAHRPTEIGSSEDLEPGLAEFELRLASGDINSAIDVLLGHANVMLQLGQRWTLLQLTGEVFEQADELEKARLLAVTGFALSRYWVGYGPAEQPFRRRHRSSRSCPGPEEVASWPLALADVCTSSVSRMRPVHELTSSVLEAEETGPETPRRLRC